jgi:pimeloyl-ACP methyl ester carboxylesterase
VLTWIARQHPSLPKPTLVGWSRGAAMSGMVAVATPGLLSNLVLFGFAFDPDLAFAELDESELKPDLAKNTRDAAASDFISPKVTPRAVIDAFVAQAMKADPILADLKNDGEFNDFKAGAPRHADPDSVRIRRPGRERHRRRQDAREDAVTDKQIVVLPGADHAAHIEDTHDAWVAAIINFITRPGARR